MNMGRYDFLCLVKFFKKQYLETNLGNN